MRRLREQYKREQKQRRKEPKEAKEPASGSASGPNSGGAPAPRPFSGSGSGTGTGGSSTGKAGKAYYTETDRDLRHLSMDVVSPGGDLGPASGGPPFVVSDT